MSAALLNPAEHGFLYSGEKKVKEDSVRRNPFHPTQNRDGVIQMGLAENQLCFDLIKKWILENPDASICTAEGVDKFKDIAIYQDYHGLKEFREAVAKFMGRVGGNSHI
ncbi:hypothetical protein CRYUN_Cryun20dG0029800 [Craigia yunnanensis]